MPSPKTTVRPTNHNSSSMTSGADPMYIVQCNSDVACPGGSLGSCPGNNMGIACSLLVERTKGIFLRKVNQTVEMTRL